MALFQKLSGVFRQNNKTTTSLSTESLPKEVTSTIMEELLEKSVKEPLNEENDKDSEKDSENSEKSEYTEQSSDDNGWTELDEDGWENVLGSGRLRRKILTPGQSQESRPVKGDHVKIKFQGKFEDKIFQESDAFEFIVEEAEVIRALDLVIALMYPGETNEIISDPELAYGDFGLPPIVPSKAAVHFEVTLIDVKSGIQPFDLEGKNFKIWYFSGNKTLQN